MSFTLRASQFFILSTRGPFIKQANFSKILVLSTLEISYAHTRLILIWALPTKLLQMQARTLQAKNSIKMQI
jgi:hypothetical protein